MATKVYTFHIAYEGLEDRIWRKVQVSSNYRLDQLGYLVLAAFDTMAYHLFEFHYDDGIFEIPNEDSPFDQIDMAAFKLHELGLKIGDCLQMDYDFGTTQTFRLELMEIEDMKRGWGKRYPCVLEGAGLGIIDDIHVEELAELVEQIDRNGRTDKPIYYQERTIPWDYRLFNLDHMNSILKNEINQIAEGYAPFWQSQVDYEINPDGNKLAITSARELAEAEEKISKKKAIQLFENGILDKLEAGTFSSLQAIHKYLFEDIYFFAGKIRTVNIAKGNFRFAPPLYLEAALEKIESMPQCTFDKIIEKYVEMNIAHPFLDGNGRSIRIWLDCVLKKEIGMVIDWSLVNKENYLLAMEYSPIGDTGIKYVLKAALTDKINDRELYMKGIDHSYYYEGYASFITKELITP